MAAIHQWGGCLVACGKASGRAEHGQKAMEEVGWKESGRRMLLTERRGVNLAVSCPCLWEKAALGLEWRGLKVVTDTTL